MSRRREISKQAVRYTRGSTGPRSLCLFTINYFLIISRMIMIIDLIETPPPKKLSVKLKKKNQMSTRREPKLGQERAFSRPPTTGEKYERTTGTYRSTARCLAPSLPHPPRGSRQAHRAPLCHTPVTPAKPSNSNDNNNDNNRCTVV